MRTTLCLAAVAVTLMSVAPDTARAQNPSQLLQGLLSGNQGQDQAVREAYERGYRQGREDQTRDDRARSERDRDRRPPPPPPRGQYPDQDQNYSRDPYRR